jgi:hypothetical protein
VAVRGKNRINGDSAGNYHLMNIEQGTHRRNGDSAGNSQLMDEESREEWLFRRKLPAQGQGIHRKLAAHRRRINLKIGVLLGITSSWKLIQKVER